MYPHQKRKFDAYAGERNWDSKRSRNDYDEDSKISRLVSEVLKQGDLGHLVIIQDENESAYVTLQNCISCTNMNLSVVKDNTNQSIFELQINEQQFAKGTFQNTQLAKKSLAEEALEKLKESCFFVFKKKNYVNVTKENLQASTSTSQTSKPPVGNESVAHKIMMKMGWTGGGLGAQEQGNLDAVVLCENVNRQGLGTGSNNLMKEITKKLADFSRSSKLLTLVFDADFTKEERMLIHKVARKFNLKSKSSGSESRKLTVSRKITRMDIVKELLKIGGEDGLYKLHIPTNFAHLWSS